MRACGRLLGGDGRCCGLLSGRDGDLDARDLLARLAVVVAVQGRRIALPAGLDVLLHELGAGGETGVLMDAPRVGRCR